MDDADEEPVIIYHSHTATEAYPSRTDISYASEPDAHYVLVSTARPGHGGVPLVPDRRRRGHRGAGRGGRRMQRAVELAIQRVLLGHTVADVCYDCR